MRTNADCSSVLPTRTLSISLSVLRPKGPVQGWASKVTREYLRADGLALPSTLLEVLEAQKKTTLRERMHRSLAAFGASVLTRRERQVVELVLLGHNTRLIAEKLGISIETVKLHRKHAYAKLDISSQAELFFLFMEALSHWSGDPDTDPLIAYQGGQ